MQPIKLKPSSLAPGLGDRLEPHPAMPAETTAFLADRLTHCACYLEYGGGGSTLLAARLGVRNIFTVESDRFFADELQRRLERDGHGARAHVAAVDIGETGRWGYPLTRERIADWPAYPLDVWTDLAQRRLSPDLVLIDGRFRIACFLASLLHGRAGATVLFDDYEDRVAHYGAVERFLRPDRIVGGAALFTIPPAETVRGLEPALEEALGAACLDLR